MSMVMHGSEVPTVAGAYRPESSQSDNNKTTRMVEVTKPPVLGNYLVAATKVPFDGALPPVIRRYPVQHLRRSTGSSIPDSPRIESYHPAPKLLKPVWSSPLLPFPCKRSTLTTHCRKLRLTWLCVAGGAASTRCGGLHQSRPCPPVDFQTTAPQHQPCKR